MMRTLTMIAILGACSSAPPAPATTPTAPAATRPAAPAIPLSQPGEYDIDRITRDAGKAIFAVHGIGDPYRTGLPYPIFLALLRAFPKTFGATPAELAAMFGFIARAADPTSADPDVQAGLPIGMHLTIDPITRVPFVVSACTLCHAGQVRWPGGSATVIGLANKRVRIHAYDAAFAHVLDEPGFTADKLVRLANETATAQHITWPEQYAAAFVGATIAALRQRAVDRAELRTRTEAGPPGRVATIESFVGVLAQLSHASVTYAPQVGWTKVPDVIGFAHRTTLSWDGSGEGPMDLLAVEADVAAGVRVEWLQAHPFQGASLGAYLRQPDERPKFPKRIDRALADKGRALFADHCSDCHGTYAADGRSLDYEEKIIALEDIGTDPARAQAATETFERAANDPALTLGYTRFRRTNGYVPPVLTNVWMRAPYGHAGQWPSLAVLSTPPAKRTRLVVDLAAPYDLDAVGVATHTGEPKGPDQYSDDPKQPGFGNLGHPFLADLGPDARAVIEYLKTL
jgi:mono/diheme cytochrome c family protein